MEKGYLPQTKKLGEQKERKEMSSFWLNMLSQPKYHALH